jgi:hypothetical protein
VFISLFIIGVSDVRGKDKWIKGKQAVGYRPEAEGKM